MTYQMIEDYGKVKKEKDCYPHKNFDEIKEYCLKNNLSLIDYIYRFEDEDIFDYVKNIMNVMLNSVASGLSK